MYFHLKNYTCVSEQRYIIRVLILVPAYAIYSFLSVLLAIYAMVDSIYIDFIHDIAEGSWFIYLLTPQHLRFTVF